MKKFMLFGVSVVALAFGLFLSVGSVNAQDTEQTYLGGDACNTGTDITWEIYDVDFGSVTAAQFVAGLDDIAGTEVAQDADTYVSIEDLCGTVSYYFSMTFTQMTGQDNGGTIPASAQDIVYSGVVSVNGTLSSEVTGNPAGYPNGVSPWVGNESEVILERTTSSGAVGEIDLDLTHDLDLPAATTYDSYYEGDWTVTITWL